MRIDPTKTLVPYSDFPDNSVDVQPFQKEFHLYIELLSAAFQIPSFLITKSGADAQISESTFNPVHQRILGNWFGSNSGTAVMEDVNLFCYTPAFLSALSGRLRDDLCSRHRHEKPTERKVLDRPYQWRSAEESAGCTTHSRNQKIDDLHESIMSEWLEMSSIATVALMGSRWQGLLPEAVQLRCGYSTLPYEYLEQCQSLAWYVIQTDAPCASFRRVYEQITAKMEAADFGKRL